MTNMIRWPQLAVTYIAFAFLLGCSDEAALREANANLAAVVQQENPVTGDMNSIIPEQELASVRESARRGDTYAAYRLAHHYRELGRVRERIEWLEVAGERGDCASIAELYDVALDRGDRERADRWNDRLRANRCTWANTYGVAAEGNRMLDDRPLWVD